MGRTNSEILKDRRFFSAEQEEAIHKAAAEEIKKYTKNESVSIKSINEELEKFLDDLTQTKTKQQAIKKLYKIDTKGIFHDEGWNKVREIVKEIRNMNAEVECIPANNSLYTNGYPNDGSISSKRYDLTISFTNALNKEIIIKGNITCSGCGTVEDPLSAYDVSMSFA